MDTKGVENAKPTAPGENKEPQQSVEDRKPLPNPASTADSIVQPQYNPENVSCIVSGLDLSNFDGPLANAVTNMMVFTPITAENRRDPEFMNEVSNYYDREFLRASQELRQKLVAQMEARMKPAKDRGEKYRFWEDDISLLKKIDHLRLRTESEKAETMKKLAEGKEADDGGESTDEESSVAADEASEEDDDEKLAHEQDLAHKHDLVIQWLARD